MKKKQVSIKDIAKASGVAVSTVSAALNGTGRISDEMRQRIQEIAEKQNYEPNVMAKLLKQKKSDDIALVVSDTPGSVSGSDIILPMIASFMKLCDREGIRCQIEFHNSAEKRQQVPAIITNGLAGGVLHGGYICPGMRKYLDLHPEFPFVSLEEASNYCVLSRVDSGIMNAIQCFAAFGHRKLGLVIGPREFHRQDDIYQSFMKGASDFQLKVDVDNWIVPFPEMNDSDAISFGVKTGRRIMEMKERPTAMIVGDGRIARGMIYAVTEKGGHIPEDLNIITMSSPAEAEQTCPPLTSFTWNPDESFIYAYQLLRSLMKGKIPQEKCIYTKTELTMRGTTGHNQRKI